MIYLTGDTHANIDRFLEGWAQDTLTKDDTVIILGDFGLLFFTIDNEDYYELQQMRLNNLAEMPWTTLFIDGNHDNFDLLYNLPEVNKYGSAVGEVVKDKIYYLKRSKVYTIEDQTFLTFGGALSIDKDHRVEGFSWWKEELPSKKEENELLEALKAHNFKVDYILTHSPPKFISNIMSQHSHLKFKDPVAKFLDQVASKTDFKKWYFGHMHDDVTFLSYPKFVGLYNEFMELGGSSYSATGFKLPELF